MKRRQASIDPITIEIISNGLRSIADETFVALMKSAYSTNIKERHDHSTAIIDPSGRLIVQAENSLAIHLGSMMGLMNTLLAKLPLSDVRAGDIFISNDPYEAGGSHLPDVNMAMPVFSGDKLVCFMCNIAHHADIGGITPGSMAGGTEIYQEGTRIPLIRLFRQGELQSDILDLLLLNARVPEERRGDYFAQVAACRLGVRRVDVDDFDQALIVGDLRIEQRLEGIEHARERHSDGRVDVALHLRAGPGEVEQHFPVRAVLWNGHLELDRNVGGAYAVIIHHIFERVLTRWNAPQRLK